MGYLRFFALLAVVGMACDSRAQGTKEVWLDELDLSCCIQDWGLPQADRSVLDTPLTVGGVVYGRGVGTHSISRMLFGLGGDAVSIAGAVGADDKNLFAGKHRFKILGDRKVLWDSGVMRKGDAARAFDVDLSGLDKVLLLVEEAGDGIMYDHADWLEVKITTRGEVEPLSVWARPISKGKYILTPREPRNAADQQSARIRRPPGQSLSDACHGQRQTPDGVRGAGASRRAGARSPYGPDNGPCARRRGFQGCC